VDFTEESRDEAEEGILVGEDGGDTTTAFEFLIEAIDGGLVRKRFSGGGGRAQR
jgi:hypothetical protein